MFNALNVKHFVQKTMGMEVIITRKAIEIKKNALWLIKKKMHKSKSKKKEKIQKNIKLDNPQHPKHALHLVVAKEEPTDTFRYAKEVLNVLKIRHLSLQSMYMMSSIPTLSLNTT
jgi:hypothetical protein